MDEAIAEGTHRSSHRELGRATAANMPWTFASQRLVQNLREAETIPAQLGRPDLLEDCWRDYKSVIQLHSRKDTRTQPVRATDRVFRQKLYRTDDTALIDTSFLFAKHPIVKDKDARSGDQWGQAARSSCFSTGPVPVAQ
jgi:hypothetical protein